MGIATTFIHGAYAGLDGTGYFVTVYQTDGGPTCWKAFTIDGLTEREAGRLADLFDRLTGKPILS